MTQFGIDVCRLSGFHIWGRWGAPEGGPDDVLWQSRACVHCNMQQVRRVMDVTEGPAL